MTTVNVHVVARMAHEAVRAFSAAIGDGMENKPWDDLPQSVRDSAIEGVLAHLNNPDLTWEQSHERWLDYKTKDGWKYGDKKDMFLKRHPNMVPYDELPQMQQAKNAIFKGIVSLMGRLADDVW